MKLEFEHLPKNWEIKKLGEATTIIMGQSPPSDTYNSEKIGLPFFQGKAEFTDISPIAVKWCSSPKKIAIPNDILLSVRAPVGATNVADVECSIGRGLAIVRFDNWKYLFYFLRSIEKQLDNKGTGTTFKAISGEVLRETPFPIPPLSEQQSIVQKIEELFSELDKSIENLKTAQQQIKTYRQSVLKSAFEGKLTSKKEDENLMMVAEPNLEYGDNKLPGGWKWVKVSDISTILGDGLHGTPKYDELGEYYFINGNNLSDGKIEIKENTKRINKEEYLKYKKPLNERTVLVSINGTLGNVAFFNNENVILGKSACYFNLHEEVEKLYIKYLLQSNYFIKYANETATGSTIKNVSLKSMRAFAVPLASQKEQKEIISEIESRFSVADKLEESINQSLLQAETLRQSILKRAFEGKLLKSKK